MVKKALARADITHIFYVASPLPDITENRS